MKGTELGNGKQTYHFGDMYFYEKYIAVEI
jgi:hypothetical protein